MNLFKSFAIAAAALFSMPVSAQAVTISGLQPGAFNTTFINADGFIGGIQIDASNNTGPGSFTWFFESTIDTLVDVGNTVLFQSRTTGLDVTLNSVSLAFGGTATNGFYSFPQIALSPGDQFTIGVSWTQFLSGADTDFSLFSTEQTPATPIPLPASAWLFMSALAGMALIARRRTTG